MKYQFHNITFIDCIKRDLPKNMITYECTILYIKNKFDTEIVLVRYFLDDNKYECGYYAV